MCKERKGERREREGEGGRVKNTRERGRYRGRERRGDPNPFIEVRHDALITFCVLSDPLFFWLVDVHLSADNRDAEGKH